MAIVDDDNWFADDVDRCDRPAGRDEPIVEQDQWLDHPAKHFLIRYVLRHPERGRCNGINGVVDEQLIKHYAEALDGAYDRLGEMLGWKEPCADPGERIEVIVWNTPRPYVWRGEEGRLQIYLRSELTNALTPDAVVAQAKVEATHEVAHLFTRVHDVWNAPGWTWFDEATAAYFERELNPDNIATLSNGHAMGWVYYPEAAPEILSPEPTNSPDWNPQFGIPPETRTVTDPDKRTYHNPWFIKYVEDRFKARRFSSTRGITRRPSTRRAIILRQSAQETRHNLGGRAPRVRRALPADGGARPPGLCAVR